MSKIVKSANLVDTWSSSFKCPLCGSTVQVKSLNSLVCLNRHTFDFARHGYLNLMARSVNSKYGKPLFEARHHLITKSSLYEPLHEILRDLILQHAPDLAGPWLMADLGCGEGSHLQRILKACRLPEVTGLGLDISKEGIALAARNYDDFIWMVSDLASSPLADRSCRVLLNMLSPSNYKEFTRILDQKGIIIKVVPRPGYLRELRHAVYQDHEKRTSSNEEITALFRQHFELLDAIPLSYRHLLHGAELGYLAGMTPLTWTSDPKQLQGYVQQSSAWVTVELDILVGRSRESGRK